MSQEEARRAVKKQSQQPLERLLRPASLTSVLIPVGLMPVPTPPITPVGVPVKGVAVVVGVPVVVVGVAVDGVAVDGVAVDGVAVDGVVVDGGVVDGVVVTGVVDVLPELALEGNTQPLTLGSVVDTVAVPAKSQVP